MTPYQCISCGRYFPRMLDYYRHRLIREGATTLCMTDAQMFAERVSTTAAPTPPQDVPVQHPRPPRREAEPLPAPALGHAMWLLRRGVRLEGLLKAGVDRETVRRAVAALATEMLGEAPAPAATPAAAPAAEDAALTLEDLTSECRLAHVFARGQWSHAQIAGRLGVSRALVADMVRVGGILHAGIRSQTTKDLDLLSRWRAAKSAEVRRAP